VLRHQSDINQIAQADERRLSRVVCDRPQRMLLSLPISSSMAQIHK